MLRFYILNIEVMIVCMILGQFSTPFHIKLQVKSRSIWRNIMFDSRPYYEVQIAFSFYVFSLQTVRSVDISLGICFIAVALSSQYLIRWVASPSVLTWINIYLFQVVRLKSNKIFKRHTFCALYDRFLSKYVVLNM